VVPRPLEQVLDEVQQTGVGPLHVLEHHDDRVALGEAFEEGAPGGEHVLLIAGSTGVEREEVREARLDPRAFLGVGNELLQGRPQLRRGGRRVFLLGDAAPHLHHVDERPVRHPFSVGQAASSVPEAGLREPVDVLLELPGQP
jgi:hypothetical protein